MKITLILAVLALSACSTSQERELGMTYVQLVMKYGPPNKETRIEGKRVCSWVIHSGKYSDNVVRVFDKDDICIPAR